MWNGKDNRENFEAHVNKLLEQLLELQEKGLTVSELLMPMPPCLIKLGDENVTEDEGEGEGSGAAMEWHGGRESWEDWLAHSGKLGARAREALVTAVHLHPRLNVTLDGGAWASAAGVRCCAVRPSIFTGWSKDEFAQPLEWIWLEQGETVRQRAEKRKPGDAGYMALACWAAAWRTLGALGCFATCGTIDCSPTEPAADHPMVL